MKKLSLYVMGLALCMTSCIETEPEKQYEKSTVGAYILNNGNYTDNDSNISFLDFDKDEMVYDVFENENGKMLGNLGQDLLIFGSKMYITVNGSGVIFVTDLDGKIIKEIVATENGETLSPRYLKSYENTVYVTYYQGFVGQIDTNSLSVKYVPCGPNPDQMEISDGKLYVATSGGYNYPIYCSTIDLFNASDLSGRRTLDVVTNPQYMQKNSLGEVYLISTGNYSDIPSALQMIDPATDKITTVGEIENPAQMTIFNDKLYMLTTSYDESWNAVCDYIIYDTILKKITGKVITDGTVINNGCSISVNPKNGDVYIGASDYVTNGDLYKFDSKGNYIKKYDTGGLNPIGTFFLEK